MFYGCLFSYLIKYNANSKVLHLNTVYAMTFKKFITVMFYKLKESGCNRIHHLLEDMGSALSTIVSIVNQ
jgi:hypothetical protein